MYLVLLVNLFAVLAMIWLPHYVYRTDQRTKTGNLQRGCDSICYVRTIYLLAVFQYIQIYAAHIASLQHQADIFVQKLFAASECKECGQVTNTINLTFSRTCKDFCMTRCYFPLCGHPSKNSIQLTYRI